MFIDYYAVLEILSSATLEEIKAAFRVQAIKFHPDKNPLRDTTREMQLLNEAYLILKDHEARAAYDREYARFKQQQNKTFFNEAGSYSNSTQYKPSATDNFSYNSYDIQDEVLKRWMNNAKRQAVSLAKETIRDFKGAAMAGAKRGTETFLKVLAVQLIVALLIIIITGGKGCA